MYNYIINEMITTFASDRRVKLRSLCLHFVLIIINIQQPAIMNKSKIYNLKNIKLKHEASN